MFTCIHTNLSSPSFICNLLNGAFAKYINKEKITFQFASRKYQNILSNYKKILDYIRDKTRILKASAQVQNIDKMYLVSIICLRCDTDWLL